MLFIMLTFTNPLSLFPIHNVLYSEILNYTKFFSDSIYTLAITLKLFISNILKMA